MDELPLPEAADSFGTSADKCAVRTCILSTVRRAAVAGTNRALEPHRPGRNPGLCQHVFHLLGPGKGKERDAPDSLLAESGRSVLSFPIAAPGSALRPGVSGPVLETEVLPGARDSAAPARARRPGSPGTAGPRPRRPAPQLRPRALGPGPVSAPQPRPRARVPDPGRALVPARPQLLFPRSPGPLPALRAQRPALGPRQRGRRRVPRSSTWASGGAVPRGDGRSRLGAEQREQRAGGPSSWLAAAPAAGPPRGGAGNRYRPRPGRPVTWPPRPNNAARSRQARDPGTSLLWPAGTGNY
ncbi:translation initiation factor IF-2-like [Equus quagga]|uniref:translation initiation factor IF-2-like n=1 Tax=Equus quagga TaxID=89248 RepID=UPI001EE170D3|nr:translation initiation factor IF-2-like [Equus quagga]